MLGKLHSVDFQIDYFQLKEGNLKILYLLQKILIDYMKASITNIYSLIRME